MSEKQSWTEWVKEWGTWAAKKTLPGWAATGVEMLEKMLAPGEGEMTDYSHIDSHIKACEGKLSKVSIDPESASVDINDLQKMYSLKHEADKGLKKAKKALESMSISQMAEKGNATNNTGLAKRRVVTEEQSTRLSDIEETLNGIANTLFDQKIKPVEEQIKVIKQLARKATTMGLQSVVREYQQIQIAVEKAEVRQQAAQEMFDAIPTKGGVQTMKDKLLSKEKEIISAKEQFEQGKVDLCKREMKTIDKKVKAINERVRAAQAKDPKVKKSDNFTQECANIRSTITEIEKYQEEIQDMLDALPTSDEMEKLKEELAEKEKNVEEAAKLVEAEIESAKEEVKVDECKQEMRKIDKKIKGIKQRARAAQMQNPKVRKTDNFARDCAKMHEELEKIETCQEKIQDMLDALPTSEEIETLKEELEKNVEGATKLVEEAEHPPAQPVSCVCAVM